MATILRMRRAVLATFLCTASLAAASADASAGLRERQALREVLRAHAPPTAALPLPEREVRAGAAAGQGELVQIARAGGPQRILVGVRSHRHLPGVAAALRRLGAAPETFAPVGVLAATVPSGVDAARVLGSDRRVAYVERDHRLRLAADPFDAQDPETGIPYTWFYDEVKAAQAIAAAGGGSRRIVAVMDTGLDVNHRELAGRYTRTFDTLTRGTEVTDLVGHGTFVSGLIAGIDGNGYGGKGVAGETRLLAIRGSRDGSFTESDLLRGIDFAIRRGGDVLNLSLAGDGPFHSSVQRALRRAFFSDVLPVAASGNKGATASNPPQYPARALGGRRGARGIGLSVAATRPGGVWADFSTHNPYVSLAAPGAGANPADERFGVFSALPATPTEWDGSASRLHSQEGVRFAYGEGTSFAAPIVSGIAALVWQVEPRLASEQVAEVLTRSARQTMGSDWNRYTGAGVVDGERATALARAYDVRAPRARGRAQRAGATVRVRVIRTRDRTYPGRERAGQVRLALLVSRDGGRSFDFAVRSRSRGFTRPVALRGRRLNVIVASACDGNGNCGTRRLGRYRP